MKSIILMSLLFLAIFASSCQSQDNSYVVVYTSVDQIYSEPIFNEFEKQTGIEVLEVYDVEASKTTGLVNRLIAEKNNPQADVFWNGEFMQTMYLQAEGILAPYASSNSTDIPSRYKDPENYWVGFGGRARVLLINTDLLTPDQYPESILDFVKQGYWQSDQIGMAYPLFGTSATHATALYALWGEERAHDYFARVNLLGVRVVDGNSVVRDMVADGQLAFGITDTDDACGSISRGDHVAVVFPDQEQGQIGTLIIPNSVALIDNGPNPDNGKIFIDYLLSHETEIALLESGWSQITLRHVEADSQCFSNITIIGMDLPLYKIYEQYLPARDDLATIFIR